VSLVVLLSAALGCSSTDPLTSAEVALYDSDGSTNDAAFAGSLSREDGCLHLRSGGARTLPLFPRGDVRWDGTLLTYDGRSYRLGDEVLVGGSESQPRPGASVPASCDQDVSVWVVAPARR
jgi:hypothetical protein